MIGRLLSESTNNINVKNCSYIFPYVSVQRRVWLYINTKKKKIESKLGYTQITPTIIVDL